MYGAASMEEVGLVERHLVSIFGTPRGTEMLVELESRKRAFGIDLTEAGVANSDHPGKSNLIHIGIGFHPMIMTTDGPRAAGLIRILAHELGHAAFGVFDDGPGRMRNIRENETPIMRALGYPARTQYPSLLGP